MSNREIASNILDNLTDEQITAFITLFADENVQAMIEADRIANDPNRKHFGSFSEIEKETGFSAVNVRVLWSRGKKKLQQLLRR